MTTGTFLADLLATITERGRSALGRSVVVSANKQADMLALCHSLVSRRGEASGVTLAQQILDLWDVADDGARLSFLLRLVEDFGPDENRLDRALSAVASLRTPTTLLELHFASEPLRQELLRRLNLAPGGTARLLRMREAIFTHQRTHPALDALDADFAHLFSSWFNRGFLLLRRIDWSTPANILERIIQYEAVHEIGDWRELRARIEPSDRRLFAFFHPQMPDDPLIFVEVALTTDIPDAIATLLATGRKPIDARAATTAVFYSISNCHAGLRGVSFGNFLIKQVVDELKRELGQLKTFVTLSPAPGFAAWLRRDALQAENSLLRSENRQALLELDRSETPDREILRAPLLAAAAAYIVLARDNQGRPVDPVARFHLGNGARLERINAAADLSNKGLKQAHGVMVNYLYDLASIEANHEAFFEKGEVAASSAVRRLLAPDSTVRARG